MIGQGVEMRELLIDPRGQHKRIELVALAQERRHRAGVACGQARTRSSGVCGAS